jgi:hypothetical protein
MKLILLLLTGTVMAISTCDHCFRLAQNNFDYLPMLQNNYCGGDYLCESILRDLSYKAILEKSNRFNPCTRDPTHHECTSFSFKICNEVLGENCAGIVRDLLQKPVSPGYEATEESSGGPKKLRSEVASLRQKFLGILEELESIQDTLS